MKKPIPPPPPPPTDYEEFGCTVQRRGEEALRYTAEASRELRRRIRRALKAERALNQALAALNSKSYSDPAEQLAASQNIIQLGRQAIATSTEVLPVLWELTMSANQNVGVHEQVSHFARFQMECERRAHEKQSPSPPPTPTENSLGARSLKEGRN